MGGPAELKKLCGKEEIERRTQKFTVEQNFGRSLPREKALSPEVFQARRHRTLRGETIDGEVMWKESAVTRMNLKSFIARVTMTGGACKVLGIVLNDGAPLKSVEVNVDDGPWQAAALAPSTREKYGWKFFTCNWTGITPGDHTLVSRVTDVTGRVQRTAKDNETKKSFLEEDSQAPRKLRVAYGTSTQCHRRSASSAPSMHCQSLVACIRCTGGGAGGSSGSPSPRTLLRRNLRPKRLQAADGVPKRRKNGGS